MRVGGQEEGMEEAGWEGKFSSYTFLFCFDLLKIFWWKSFFFLIYLRIYFCLHWVFAAVKMDFLGATL